MAAPLPEITAFVAWPSAPLTNRLVLNALSKLNPPPRVISSLPESKEELESKNILQWATYDEIDHELTIFHPSSTKVLTCAYTIRKALIRKHFLSRSAHRHIVKHPESPLKAGVPRTWELELQHLDELDEMWTDELWDLGEELDKGEQWMILKPGMADRGLGVRIFHTKEDLESIFEEFEDEDDEDDMEVDEDEDDRYNTNVATSQLRHFVIQEYLSNPLLLDPSQVPLDGTAVRTDIPNLKGHKFHLRAYCVASGALSVYLYTRILALFSSVPYAEPTSDENIGIDLAAHITNTSLQTDKGEKFVRLLDELAGCSILSGTSDAERALSAADLDDIRDQVAVLLGEAFRAALGMSVHFQPLPNAFELFGVDFLVTHHPQPTSSRRFHVSLLEVNAEPAIELTGPRLTWILEDLFCSIAKVCIAPFFRDQSNGEAEQGECRVGETREHLRKCADIEVRGAGGW